MSERFYNANPYSYNGYKDRADYLASLADDFGVDLFVIQSMADILGENEDFDGLVTALEDGEGWF